MKKRKDHHKEPNWVKEGLDFLDVLSKETLSYQPKKGQMCYYKGVLYEYNGTAWIERKQDETTGN